MALDKITLAASLTTALQTYATAIQPEIAAALKVHFTALQLVSPPLTPAEASALLDLVAANFAKAYTIDVNGSAALTALTASAAQAMFDFVTGADVTVTVETTDVGLQQYDIGAGGVDTTGPTVSRSLAGALS